MRIFSVNTFNNPNNTHNIYNKKGRINSCESLYAPLSLNEPPRDTVTFTAQVPYKVITMDQLIEKTVSTNLSEHTILSLADRFDIPCPVCKKTLYGVKKFKAFEKRVNEATTTKELLDAILPDKKYLHDIEREIYEMFVAENKKDPSKSLHNILKEKLWTEEPLLIHKQSDIFFYIQLLNKENPTPYSKAIQDLIFETYARIFDPRKTSRFSRKIFKDKLTSIIEQSNDIKLKLDMISTAAELPTSYNDKAAFIVKYAKRNYKDADPNKKIALRMLSNSLVTEEHSIARSKGGSNEPHNIALECACDNNRRGNAPILTQVLENPEMIVNYPFYVAKLCELNREIGLSKSYILGNYNIYNTESEGLLKIPPCLLDFLNGDGAYVDIKDIRPVVSEFEQSVMKLKDAHVNIHHKSDRLKSENVIEDNTKDKVSCSQKSGITPTKAERRAARKEKLKQKKQFKPDKKRIKYTDSRFDRRN